MFTRIKYFFRQRCLRKRSSKEPTGIRPLSQIHSAVTFIKVENKDFNEINDAVLRFYKENNIKGEIFFFDFRKIGKEEKVLTDTAKTIFSKDLNWFGKPLREKAEVMLKSEADVFISLIKGRCFPIEYMAKCSKAKFKIGREQLAGRTFDLVLKEPKGKTFSETEIFNELKTYLEKIAE